VSKALLENFERALSQRNPILAERLQPGLSESRIRRMLQRVKAEGAVEPVVELFAWKNGSVVDPSIAQHASPFPNSNFIFMDLEMMAAHFRGFDECAVYHPRYTKIVGKYFPLFWDGSDCWLAVDLNPRNQTRVVLVETQSEHMVRQVYDSFDGFLRDAIHANEKRIKLTCFAQEEKQK
jgi:hypothetical protein